MSWSIGVVVIGRNEGARLRRCLASVQRAGVPVIYVDSASSDASVDVARAHAAHVVELDPDEPLCAARARNAGKNALQELYPECTFVCFVDGDCELAQGWIAAASYFLTSHDRLAAVAVRCRIVGRRETGNDEHDHHRKETDPPPSTVFKPLYEKTSLIE